MRLVASGVREQRGHWFISDTAMVGALEEAPEGCLIADDLLLFDLPSDLELNPPLHRRNPNPIPPSTAGGVQDKSLSLLDILDSADIPTVDGLPVKNAKIQFFPALYGKDLIFISFSGGFYRALRRREEEEEEELEWLLNKDVFPALEMSFEIPTHSRSSGSGRTGSSGGRDENEPGVDPGRGGAVQGAGTAEEQGVEVEGHGRAIASAGGEGGEGEASVPALRGRGYAAVEGGAGGAKNAVQRMRGAVQVREAGAGVSAGRQPKFLRHHPQGPQLAIGVTSVTSPTSVISSSSRWLARKD